VYHLVSLSTNTTSDVFPSRVRGNATIRSMVTVATVSQVWVMVVTSHHNDYSAESLLMNHMSTMFVDIFSQTTSTVHQIISLGFYCPNDLHIASHGKLLESYLWIPHGLEWTTESLSTKSIDFLQCIYIGKITEPRVHHRLP
jgi:hypothetical protein